MTKTRIAKWLEVNLERLGRDRRDLADALGIKIDKLNKVFIGVRRLQYAEFVKAAEYFGVGLPSKEFLEGDEDLDNVVEFTRVPIGEEFSRPYITPDQRGGVSRDEIPQVDATLGMGLSLDAESIDVELGKGTSAALPVLDTWRVPISVLQRRVRTSIGHLHFVECEGDSMKPIINDGDVVLIDQTKRNPNMPGIFALWEGDGQTIKRVEIVRGSTPEKLRLIPANDAYSAYEVLASEVNIIGRYVARFTVD